MVDKKNLEKIESLEKQIIYHKELYYKGNPSISDKEYDHLESELKKISPDSYVLSLVGHENLSDKKVKHDSKMLSLNKVYNFEELEKWRENRALISTYKIDGSSASLVYENGKLVVSKTRGNGVFGENITDKTFYIDSIPKEISYKGKFEVRGEIFCTEKSFEDIKKEFEKTDLDLPTSMRNVVAGILSRKKHIHLSKHLSFQAFELLNVELESEEEKFKKLNKWGFITPDYVLCGKLEEIKNEIKKGQEFISNGNYLIDGLVFTFNEIKIHQELGSTSHHPRYKMAFKYQGESKNTEVLDILWQTSRNGVLTPVANVEPVELSGAVVSNVTLHNWGNVRDKNIKKGDLIEIVRSGEVIPKYLQTIKESHHKVERPEKCPSCKDEVLEVDIRLICENEECISKKINSILHYVKKVDIEDLSEKRIELFLEKKIIKDIPDIYLLKVEDLLELDNFKEKISQKIIDSIKKSKEVDLSKFISAIGVNGVSEVKCQKIIDAGYDTLELMQGLSIESISEINGFAEKSAETFISSLKNKGKLIATLLNNGVVIKKASQSLQGVFSDLSFCITGTLNNPRSVVKKFIENHGGKVVSTVSSKTNYLVTNDKESNSSKFKKAQELGIEIISQEKLETLKI